MGKLIRNQHETWKYFSEHLDYLNTMACKFIGNYVSNVQVVLKNPITSVKSWAIAMAFANRKSPQPFMMNSNKATQAMLHFENAKSQLLLANKLHAMVGEEVMSLKDFALVIATVISRLDQKPSASLQNCLSSLTEDSVKSCEGNLEFVAQKLDTIDEIANVLFCFSKQFMKWHHLANLH